MSGFPPTSLSSSGGGVSQHPPTPPRTPKTPLGGTSSPRFGLPPDHLKLAGVGSLSSAAPSSFNPASGNGMASGMPPLLSLAAIQDQVGKGAPNILASQLSKPPSMMLAGKSSEPCTTYNYMISFECICNPFLIQYHICNRHASHGAWGYERPSSFTASSYISSSKSCIFSCSYRWSNAQGKLNRLYTLFQEIWIFSRMWKFLLQGHELSRAFSLHSTNVQR